MLTKQMNRALDMIADGVEATGVTPSFDELKDALGLKSKSGVHRLILSLEERGYIRRIPNRARAIEVLRRSDARTAATPPKTANGSVSLPCMGRIAAGVPIAALQDVSRMVGVPTSLVGAGEHYCLDVKGDSMIEEGIVDGDTIVVRRTESVEDGAIVVALIDDGEATLKRIRRNGKEVSLHAANPAYETRIYAAGRVKVQGRLVGLMRNY